MKRYWSVFKRVLRTYSVEEKTVSIIVVAIVFIVGMQGIISWFSSPNLMPGEGGLYVEGLINERSTLLNPVYVDFADANREVSSLIFSGLTKYDPEVKAFVKDLADLTISEDWKTYRFELKEGVSWHDGEPLTADDVYFTFHDIIQHPDFQNPVIRANFGGVDINQIDDRVVEFTLDKPNSFFITNLNVGILPKHILGDTVPFDLPQSKFNLNPIGTGPYMLDGKVEILADGRYRVPLSAYDKYYGEQPKIKKVRFNIYPNKDFLLNEKSTLNVISTVPRGADE